MRKLLGVVFLCACVFGLTAQAQQLDASFGLGTTTSSDAASAGPDFSPVSLGGGTHLTFAGDYLFWHHLGVGGEITWRAGQNSYAGILPYRPIFYDINAVYAPPLGEHAAAELMAGFGAENLHFYTGQYNCSFTSCTNYQSSNHLMGHIGGGVRLYVKGNIFVRPEAHVYFVRNNFEFSGPRVTRFGVSFGYSWGREP